MAILMSTTGTSSPVNFDDLGSPDYTHPVTDLDIEPDFPGPDLANSGDFLAALDSGYITVKDNQGTVLTTSATFLSVFGTRRVHRIGRTLTKALYPSGAPGRGVRNARPVWEFDDVADESIIFMDVMEPSYQGNDIDVRIQWAGNGATTGDVKWNVEWERINTGLDLDGDSYAAAQTVTTTTSGTDGQTVISTISFTQAQADGILASEPYRLRLTRDADAGGDTMTVDAQVLCVVVEEQQ